MSRPPIYTPSTLADYWHCSEKHVRNLIARGELNCMRLGGKLIRIRECDVEEFECRNGGSLALEESSPLPSSKTENAGVSALTPLMRAKLTALRQRSSQR